MKYHMIALFTIFVWGMTFVSTKVLLLAFTPLWILLLRFVIGFFALCVLRPHILPMKEKHHEILFAAAGITGIAAYYLLENIALVFTTATAVGVIVAAAPLFTALAQAALGDRSALNLRFFLGFVVAMTGLIIVSLNSGITAQAFPTTNSYALLGNALALAAALLWAIYSVLVKNIANLGYETIASTKRIFFWGLLCIMPATFLFGQGVPPLSSLIDPINAANLLFLGAIASAACFVTWGVSVKNLGAAVSTTYIYLVPAITSTSSILVLGEPLNCTIIIGVLLTIAGLLLSHSKTS